MNENLEDLIEGIAQENTIEVKQIYLMAIYNLSSVEESVPDLCR